jgi:predicted aconitase with swiveling domain
VERVITAKPVVPGEVEGELLVSSESLSFWGGYEAETGLIIDRRHPLNGQYGAGKILAVPFSRGSSTTTAVLLEAIRLGNAPAAILTTGVDMFFALAAFVAEELFDRDLPVLALEPDDFQRLESGIQVRIDLEGRITSI